MSKGDTSLGGDQRGFPETLSELLVGIRHPSPDVRRAALGQLCRNYWKPIYGYIRVGWAKSNEDAKDLTQAFLSWLSEGGRLERYEPGRASFKTFLKSLLRHFLQHAQTAEGRLKRGGTAQFISLEGAAPSLEEASANLKATTPEDVFDREWLRELVSEAVSRIRKRLQSRGRDHVLHIFEAYDLRSEHERPTYEELSKRFGVSVSDITNHLHAVRAELRDEIRERLRETCGSEEESQAEWKAFLNS